MKYNLGSGVDYRFGWVDVDREPDAAPGVVWDLGAFPWPFGSDSADEMPPGLLPRVMQELYRVCRDGAKVTIRGTDPRHADAGLKPTGAGGVAPGAFQSYDLAVVEDWLATGLRHTPSSLHARADFAARSTPTLRDARWAQALQDGALEGGALTAATLGQNNVVACSETVLEARKPFAPGRTFSPFIVVALGLPNHETLLWTRAWTEANLAAASASATCRRTFAATPRPCC